MIVEPSATPGASGLIAIVWRTAADTVSVAVSLIAPTVAVITLVPSASALASPFEPATLETVAVAGVPEFQAALSVTNCLLASEKNPVATNCNDVPAAIDGVAGVTTIETSVAFVTVKTSVPVTVTAVAPVPVVTFAVIVAGPAFPLADASPAEPAAPDTVTLAADEAQTTVVVRSCVVESV